MRNTAIAPLAALTLLAGATSANAQFDFGATAGLYMPAGSAVRDAFGSSVFKFGIGGVGKQRSGNLKIGTQLDFITASRDGNRMFLAPLTLNVEQALTLDQSSMTVPYVKGFVGLAYMDYGITRLGERHDDKLIRATYGAELGMVVSERVRIFGRYNIFPKTGPFDFSGLTLGASVSFTP